jgi:hypothetical protein
VRVASVGVIEELEQVVVVAGRAFELLVQALGVDGTLHVALREGVRGSERE